MRREEALREQETPIVSQALFSFLKSKVKTQAVHPLGHFILAGPTAEPLAVQPLGVCRQFLQTVGAGADAAGTGGAEGHDGGVAEVTALQEGVNHLGGLPPPDGILKCSPSSPALENTGLNGLHKCVFCSF